MTLMNYTRPNLGLFGNRPAYDSLGRLQDEIERLMEAPLAGFGSQFFNLWAPALDVYEDKENLVVTLEVPGMKKEGFEIALHDGVLSIAGERRFDEKRQKASGYRAERFEGRQAAEGMCGRDHLRPGKVAPVDYLIELQFSGFFGPVGIQASQERQWTESLMYP